MARPLDLSKVQTEMVTIEDLQPDGSFKLVNNSGDEIGTGQARVSQRHPGYLTLVFSRHTSACRVPIDWTELFR